MFLYYIFGHKGKHIRDNSKINVLIKTMCSSYYSHPQPIAGQRGLPTKSRHSPYSTVTTFYNLLFYRCEKSESKTKAKIKVLGQRARSHTQ